MSFSNTQESGIIKRNVKYRRVVECIVGTLYLMILSNPPRMDLLLVNVRNEEYIHLEFASSHVQRLYSSHLCTFQDPTTNYIITHFNMRFNDNL